MWTKKGYIRPPNNRVLGPKYNIINGIWALKRAFLKSTRALDLTLGSMSVNKAPMSINSTYNGLVGAPGYVPVVLGLRFIVVQRLVDHKGKSGLTLRTSVCNSVLTLNAACVSAPALRGVKPFNAIPEPKTVTLSRQTLKSQARRQLKEKYVLRLNKEPCLAVFQNMSVFAAPLLKSHVSCAKKAQPIRDCFLQPFRLPRFA